MTATFDWTSVAPAWDRHRDHAGRHTEPISQALLAAAALSEGDRVLELASGTGDLAVQLATLVGPTGTVLATDNAVGMVELTATTLAGAAQAGTAVLDAGDTKLADASFDAVVCAMGLMFVPDPGTALRDWHRILAPGGRVAAAVWAAPCNNLWVAAVGMSAGLNGVVAGGPPTEPGGLFSLSDAAQLGGLAREAGFGDVTVDRVAVEFSFPSVEEHFTVVSSLAGPLAAALDEATPEQLSKVRETCAGIVAPHQGDNGSVTLPGEALILSGRVN